MTKTLTTLDIRNIGGTLYSLWPEQKSAIKLSGKNLHSLISLKKSLEGHLMTVEETITGLAMQFDGIAQENGAVSIPPARRAEANAALAAYAKETLTIDYTPIQITESDVIPVDLYEVLFDFIEFVDLENK